MNDHQTNFSNIRDSKLVKTYSIRGSTIAALAGHNRIVSIIVLDSLFEA